jgi:putative glutamine amidotransferase
MTTMVAARKRDLTLGYCEMNGDYIQPFNDIFKKKQRIATEGLSGVDAVILWGGTDIHPSYYGQKQHPYNGAPRSGFSSRDSFEWSVMLHCKANKIPMIGVCRGAQFLTIFAGGKLIQHVTGHSMGHDLTWSDGKITPTNSVHHQMMYPFDIPHTMLAWASENRSNFYEGEEMGVDGLDMKGKVEPEVVYYPEIRSIAIQGHPEYANAPSSFIENVLIETVDYLGLC